MFHIRTERADDYEAIRLVHERAFAPSLEEAGIVEGLRAEGALVVDLSLVALQDDGVVGHVGISRARLDTGVQILLLAPMGVLPERQRRGAGSALVREALKRAERTDFPLVSLVGHSSYYPCFGFERAEGYDLVAPIDVPPDAWMMYRLPAYSEEAHGTVIWPKAFGAS